MANRPDASTNSAPHNVARARTEPPAGPTPGRSPAEEQSSSQVSATPLDDESSETAVGGPARPYSWPPFEPGNTASLVHGAYSERAIAERAELVHAELLEVAPWCDEDRFLPSVHRYLQATAREQLAHEALMASTKLSPRLLETATAAARLAWQMGDQLGLTPAGHARLKLVVAGATHAEATLADLAAEGREILARRQAGQAAQEVLDAEPDDEVTE